MSTDRHQPLRVAAVDCGTNSIRLLVAEVGDDGALSDVVRRMEIVRLGQDIDRTGVIAPEAMERTLAVTREYAAQCRDLGVQRVRFVATSASRDARNAADFVDGVHRAFREVDLDVAVEVVDGDTEARLSFTGATAQLASVGVPGPFVVVDIGGGSTELVRGTTDVEAARSVDVGSVRLTERHLRSDPPLATEVEAARRDVCRGARRGGARRRPHRYRCRRRGRGEHHDDHRPPPAPGGLRPGCRAPRPATGIRAHPRVR